MKTPRLGERLVEKQLINDAQLRQALERQRDSGELLGQVLVSLEMISEKNLAPILSAALDVPLADLHNETPDPEAVALVPEDFGRRRWALPVRRDNGQLVVAMNDPLNLALINDLQLLTGLHVIPNLATKPDIQFALSRVHRVDNKINKEVQRYTESRPRVETGRREVRDLTMVSAESPAVEIVNLLIRQGLNERASDIHIEPSKSDVKIRFRVDGVLTEVARLPSTIGPALASRLKVMGDMNIVERRRAQDGQISLTVDGHDLDIRVATMETIWGEKLVLRLLDRSRTLIALEQLGMAPGVYDGYRRSIHSPFGMVIIAGPTGSGKTTTLYSSLRELVDNQKNIMTIEDPVEYTFEDINQTQINRMADMTFANGLRAVLRQDPDIILVGEIRDLETAEIAVQSALTGHMVLASMHATDAVGGLLRFLDMGIEGFLVTSSVVAIVAQRLVRRICDSCKVQVKPTFEDLEFARTLDVAMPRKLFRGEGCPRCHKTGYFDRVAVYEMLLINEEIKSLVIERAGHAPLIDAAVRGGMTTMRRDAWDKAVAGTTTVSEIIRSVYVL